MFQAAAAAFIPGADGVAAKPEPVAETRSEIDALREQMADMQKMLDKLVK
jgi:polyhydroxyalkanoate synthesis regulator phasin